MIAGACASASSTVWPSCAKFGIAWENGNGCGVHCTCGRRRLESDFELDHHHALDCGVVRTNFRCGAAEVRWYKYIGRDVEVGETTSEAEWRDIFDRCEASIAGLVVDMKTTPELTP